MTGTFASRAFFRSAATFGSEATHDGRGGQIALVRSSTRNTAPFTGTSTATASGIFGMLPAPAGLALAAGDEGLAAVEGVVVAVGVGEGLEVAAGAHAATARAVTSARSRRMVAQYTTRSGARMRPPSACREKVR